MPPEEIGRMVAAQIGALQALAVMAGTTASYVKPHGALANLAADDRVVADAIVATVAKIDPPLHILAISGMQLERAARDAGLIVYSEIFADRGYLSSGQLVPRGQESAMIHDPVEASDRLLRYLDTGLMPVIDGDPIRLEAHSICVHGDGAGTVAMARMIHDRLTAAGVAISGVTTA